jgi:NADH-quinone oxidoreductase subunit G
MEGYPGQPPPALVREYWAPGWNSVQALNKFQGEVGGPLKGGLPPLGVAGRRLIEPAAGGQPGYFGQSPAPFQAREGEWLIVPLYHIFGSEELSVLAPGIAELAPEPYVGLNPDGAERLDVQEGQTISLTMGEAHTECRLPVKLVASLPQGVAGVMAGAPGLPGPITGVMRNA